LYKPSKKIFNWWHNPFKRLLMIPSFLKSRNNLKKPLTKCFIVYCSVSLCIYCSLSRHQSLRPVHNYGTVYFLNTLVWGNRFGFEFSRLSMLTYLFHHDEIAVFRRLSRLNPGQKQLPLVGWNHKHSRFVIWGKKWRGWGCFLYLQIVPTKKRWTTLHMAPITHSPSLDTLRHGRHLLGDGNSSPSPSHLRLYSQMWRLWRVQSFICTICVRQTFDSKLFSPYSFKNINKRKKSVLKP
jgi:hypothetical protein